mmetsp:Transcript_14289/g.19895  ORF Transcript_14289/g.19895 Transcript_14289/m.19895 type:complete len:131 (-) Transcript_14289:2078-2470(-)
MEYNSELLKIDKSNGILALMIIHKMNQGVLCLDYLKDIFKIVKLTQDLKVIEKVYNDIMAQKMENLKERGYRIFKKMYTDLKDKIPYGIEYSNMERSLKEEIKKPEPSSVIEKSSSVIDSEEEMFSLFDD